MTDIVIPGMQPSHIKSWGATYAAARAGTGTKTVESGSPGSFRAAVGQLYTGFSDWTVWQTPLKFYIGDIDPDVMLDSVVLSGVPYAVDDTQTFTVYAYRYNWGASVGIGDFIPGASIPYCTLMAGVATGDLTAGTRADFTSETALLAALETGADRAAVGDYLQLMLVSSRQRQNNTPDADAEKTTWYVSNVSGTYEFLLTLTYTGYAKSFLVEMDFEPLEYSLDGTFTYEAEFEARLRYRAQTAQLQAGTVRAYNHTKTLQGVLPGSVRTTKRLDGTNSIDLLIPWRYGKVDGTSEERSSMITGGWYLEHCGEWYRIQDFRRNVYDNQLPVQGLGAEVDLKGFLTNYSQVPFWMPSHTPTEIMEAVFSGLPECEWYNGSFEALDSAGFPLGWTPDVTTNWRAATTDIGDPVAEAYAFTGGAAELVSDGLTHTSGAEIKVLVDVWVAVGFSGTVSVTLSWQNAAGVESYAESADVTYIEGEWVTFESAAWQAVKNQRCVMEFAVTNNSDAYAVRFRSARFVQNEDSTGWNYQGTMDTRATAVAYNDAAWQLYGAWTTDVVNSIVHSSTEGDVLARVFTGDMVTVSFAAGEAGSVADILVDGVSRVVDLAVETARDYEITGLNRYRSHSLEVVVGAAKKVAISGLTLSAENRIAVTWNRMTVYDALRELKGLVGGEYYFDTARQIVYHDATQGEDLTANNIMWFREGVNLADFVPEDELSAVQNRIYWAGYGEGAFQIGLTLNSTDTDGDGNTSQTLYGVQRFSHTNRDIRDLAAGTAEAEQKVEAGAFPMKTYRGSVPDDDAAYLAPGDTVQVTHQTIGTVKLRVLEVTRTSDGGTASVLWGDRVLARDPAAQLQDIRRKVEQLLRT